MSDGTTVSSSTFDLNDQEEMQWGTPGSLAEGGLGRTHPLQSQGSLRLRSQASLKNFESSTLLHQSSQKVSMPTASIDAMQTTGLRTAIRSRLQDLDANQDGVIETEELVSFIENVISTENRLKQLKLVAGLLIVFMGVFMAATFGLTYVVADMHKDTITMAGAMADKATGDVLRTAQGGYMELNYTAVNAALPYDSDEMLDLEEDLAQAAGTIATATRATFQGSGRRLQQSKGPPAGTISRINAETGCRWLTEGNININMKVLDRYGSHYPAGGATVADATGCRELARAPNSRAAITGTIVYHKITYSIRCQKGAGRCSIRRKDSLRKAPRSSSKGRRLSADGEEAEGPRLQEGPQLQEGVQQQQEGPQVKEGQQLQEEVQQQKGPQLKEGPKQRALPQCPPVEVGGVWLPVEASTNGDCPACFPAAATALRKDGTRVAMSDLAVGDLVQIVEEGGGLGWSPVFMFPHFQRAGANAFVRLTTSSMAVITLSADHFAYVAPFVTARFSARQAIAARAVAAGDLLWVAQPDGSIAAEAVTALDAVSEEGLVNPFTLRGNIVVDGIAASVYNDAMGQEARMHSFVTAGRALWHTAPSLLRAAHSYRLAQPISLAIGRFFSKHLRVEDKEPTTAFHWFAARLAAVPSQMLPTL